MSVINPFDFFVEPYAETFPFAYPDDIVDELNAYTTPEPAGPLLRTFLHSLPEDAPRTIDFLVELNARLQTETRYVIRMEPGVQTPEQTLALRSGSCRDSAWLLVQIAAPHRSLAARFVSGYLIQLRADIDPIDGPKGTDHDFTDLHAWAEIYIPGAGWIGFDATSGLLCGEGHMPLFAAPHYRNAAPISGAVEAGAKAEFAFDMTVTRIREAPRVTWPFSDEAWAKLDALGGAVDRDLAAQDVRLTMGGEPTFVSIDDFQAAEWNTAAVGPTKRRHADDLIRRLRSASRQAASCITARASGIPARACRAGRSRCTGARTASRSGPIRRWSPRNAARAMRWSTQAAEICERIRRASRRRRRATRLPAYEDPAHWLLKEAELPVNVDLTDPKIDDPEERCAHGARPSSAGSPSRSAMSCRCSRWNAEAREWRWVSEKWTLRRGRLFLMPGDSPVGLRLPLGSLPWVPPSDYPHIYPQDPTQELPPLPTARELAKLRTQNPLDMRRSRPAPATRQLAEIGGSCAPR